MRRLTVTLSTTIATALVLVVGSAGTAAARPRWTPYHQDDVTVTAARSTCAFDVRETVVAQHEEYLTTRSYPDGTPRTQIFRGPLTMRFTNLSSGHSVVRDLGGTGRYDYRADGSPLSLTSLHGPFGATMTPGSTPATGIFVFTGAVTTLTLHTDDTRSYRLGPRGTAENLCTTLAG